jgi:hypothetical protein
MLYAQISGGLISLSFARHQNQLLIFLAQTATDKSNGKENKYCTEMTIEIRVLWLEVAGVLMVS